MTNADPGNFPVHDEPAADPAEAAARVMRKILRDRPPPADRPVLVKPNIVQPSPPPVTTDPGVVRGVVEALREAGCGQVFIAEGSGTGDSIGNLESLGFGGMGAALVDLDRRPCRSVRVPEPEVWPEILLPEIALESWVVSVPVLKDHSMLGVTIGLKNMVGALPARRYSGYWSYKKSEIHRDRPHGCVSDLIKVLPPDAVVVDATVGLRGSHISGTPFRPPLGRVFGSADALAADLHGCALLGRDWRDIEYLRRIAAWWKPPAP